VRQRLKPWLFWIAALVGVAMSVDVSSGRPILGSRWALLLRIGVWCVAWIVAAWAAPSRRAVIIGVAVALRLAALAGPPVTSDDLYRYAWDGRVQAAGIDPYAQPPSVPVATGPLRDQWLWPTPAGCAALHRAPGCTRINRPTERTIYPPVAEAWFTVVHVVDGGDQHKPFQVAGLVVEMFTVLLLVSLVGARKAAWYALCPLPVLEFVNNAHVDGLAVLLSLAAFVVLAGRSRRRDTWFGLLIGAAALVKLYPGLLLLAWPRRRAFVAAALLSVVTYFPHVLAVGVRVLGYLPGYLHEEKYSTGGRFLLAGALGLSGHLAAAASVGLVLAPAAWVLVRTPHFVDGAVVLLAGLFMATTPVQPWYAVSLIAFGTLAGAPYVFPLVLAAYPYFFAVILDYKHAVVLGRACYVAGVVVMVAMFNARQQKYRPLRGGLVQVAKTARTWPLRSRNVSSPPGAASPAEVASTSPRSKHGPDTVAHQATPVP
jgi:hypothetical protein